VPRALLCLLLAVACSGSQRVHRPKGSRLVVLIVIDQLPMWTFERDRARFTGGIARMLRDGEVITGELPYANPLTAPGHAAIGTGAPPSVTGVLGNTWYRRAEDRERDAEYDPDAPLLAVGPPAAGVLSSDDNGSSKALRVDGIADSLRAATRGRGHSIAIALKARAACFVAGRHPDLAVWYEAAAGGMTTSRAYADEAPRWLVELAASHPVSGHFHDRWMPLDPRMLGEATGIPDDAPGEGSPEGLGASFPHDLGTTAAPAKALVHTPSADEIELETAYAALDALELGKDDVPDLLAISFNAHDYAGHAWGPDSWEVLDLTLRLDRALGKLFTALDDRIGVGEWSVVLTSDHGATPVVERARRSGARRISSAELIAAIDTALAAYGKGPWVAKIDSGNVYMVSSFARQPRRDQALTAASAALARIPGVATAGVTAALAGGCERRRGLDPAICRSIVDGESGELYVVAKAGSVITDYRTGTHHDAPSDDNLKVPILILAPGVAHREGTGSLLQVAPTVTSLLGVPPPAAATMPSLVAR